jgi:hypothetical protein
VLAGSEASIDVEPLGELADGIEFAYMPTFDGIVEVHQAKG